MKIVFKLFFIICLATFSAWGRPHFNLPLPNSKAAIIVWCRAYHHYLNRQCFLNGGDVEICQDTSLRRLTKQMGGPEKSCQQNPGPGLAVAQCTSYFRFYLNHCPVIKGKAAAIKPQVDYRVIRNVKLNPDDQVPRHAILIGLDGARYDAIKRVYQQLSKTQQLPHLVKFIRRHGIRDNFYAGGVKGTQTQQATVSEPGWTSELTGVWVNQHHIKDNHSIETKQYNQKIPTLFNALKRSSPNAIVASLSDWAPNGEIANFQFNHQQPADINLLYLPNNLAATYMADARITHKAIKLIKNKFAPMFIYIHFDSPDETGHMQGFSPQSKPYLSAIKKEFINVNQMIETLQRHTQSPWLVIITTDHGGHGYIHGTQNKYDRQVFAVMGVIHGKTPCFSNKLQGQTAFFNIVLNYLRI